MNKKIILDESCKKDFIKYALERVKESNSKYHDPKLYMTEESIIKEYNKLINKAYCNNKGEFYLKGEKIVYIPSKIWITEDNKLYKAGDVLEDRKTILEYENYCFENDYNLYREENLFDNVYCEIERELRVKYYK